MPGPAADNWAMDTSGKIELTGHVENGVIVLEGGASLPEGAQVRVVYGAGPTIHVSAASKPVELPLVRTGEPGATKRRVEFPLVRTGEPGSLRLTNEEIHEILQEEEIEALKEQGNVPS